MTPDSLDPVAFLRQKGVQVSMLRLPEIIHPGIEFETPCVIQAEMDFSTIVRVGAFSGIYGGRLRHTAIGRYCSIAPDVQFGWDEHPSDWLTSSMIAYVPDVHGFASFSGLSAEEARQFTSTFNMGNNLTQVGNDVWIGHGAFIKKGVKIGDGAIVAAKSVVTKDVEPYSIVGGTPAKLIRYRFPDRIIHSLLDIKWWRFNIYDFPPGSLASIETSMEWLAESIGNESLTELSPIKISAADIDTARKRHSA